MTFTLTRKGIFAFALAIGFVTAIFPCSARGSSRAPRYINSSGQEIPTIFWALRPDASVLNRVIASLKSQALSPHLQNLAYKEGCPKKTLRNVALPQISCNGNFMTPEYLSCGISCGGHSFQQFCSCGMFDCSGYYYNGDACNGCELRESSCDPCA